MKDGRSYVASSSVKPQKVLGNKQFRFAVIGLVHGHVHGIIKGLCDAGASVFCVWTESESKTKEFLGRYGNCKVLSCPDEVLSEECVDLVINCIMPDIRADFSVKCLNAGKSVFSDKPGFLTLSDGERISKAVKDNNRHFCIYFSEHFHHEGVIKAYELVSEGRIGKVFDFIAMGPHRLNASFRDPWFFKPEINGDVIVDLGCHLIEQFLLFTGNNDARIICSQESNVSHPEYPDFFDAGTVTLEGANGATGHIHVDWFTPDGISSWGDCRAFIYGTEGEIEVRKYTDAGYSDEADHVIIADNNDTKLINAHNNVGFEFFGKLMLDCINNTNQLQVNGLTLSDFCIKAMELSIIASRQASRIPVISENTI